MMIQFHAVLIGEDGMEFGHDIEAASKDEAREELREYYPEAHIESLESPEESRAREMRVYQAACFDYEDELLDEDFDEDYLAENCLN